MSKTRQWAMLTAVACLAVIAAGWFLVVKPQRSHASQLRTQAASIDTSNSQLTAQVQQLRAQQRDLPAQQKILSSIATKIPDNPALPSLIRELSTAADGAGVTLVSLAPSTPALVTKTGVAATSTSAAAPASAPLASIPIAIQVQGTYFNVEQFFAAVEQLNRAMLVSGFTIAPATGSTGSAPTGTTTGSSASTVSPGALNAQINATVFESPQVAPAAAVQPSTTSTVH